MTGTAARQAVIVVGPDCGDPAREVGGLSLLERLFRQIVSLGSIEEIVVVAAPHRALSEPSARITVPVRTVCAPDGDAWRALRAAASTLRERVVVTQADLLVDERILRWLADQTSDALIAIDTDGRPVLLGSIARSTIVGPASRRNRAVRVSPSDLPTYWPERRGDVPVHCLRVTRRADVARAWPVLLDHVQKRALDLPARYFDPPFEAFVVRRLCGTRVTPNQVTAATGVLGFVVAALFGAGWLRCGVLLAIFVEVLDGVDGKLARIQYRTSRVGELEHVLDFVYENSWYVALGVFFAASGIAWARSAAVAMVACDVVDNLVNMAFARARGRSLAEATPFLGRFRLVSGRRNVYAWLFLPGFLVGWPAASFAAGALWAVVTAVVHTVAAAWIVGRSVWSERRTRRATGLEPELDDAAPAALAASAERGR